MLLQEYINTLNVIQLTGLEFGNKLYKICPKCNDEHNGDCVNCAWRGASSGGCDIGVRVYPDGSYGDYDLQVIETTLTIWNLPNVTKWWNIQYFPTYKQAEQALASYEDIRNIQDKSQRVSAYCYWAYQRQNSFLN